MGRGLGGGESNVKAVGITRGAGVTHGSRRLAPVSIAQPTQRLLPLPMKPLAPSCDTFPVSFPSVLQCTHTNQWVSKKKRSFSAFC